MASALRNTVNPSDEELVGRYLKNKILGQSSGWESKLVNEIDMYGDGEPANCSVPVGRDLFLPKDNNFSHFPWKIGMDPTKPGKASNLIFIHVFTKLSSNGGRLVPGVGTWHPSTETEAVHDGETLIGYKRSFTLKLLEETPPLSRDLEYSMIEYTINPAAHGITGGCCGNYVLCKLSRPHGVIIDKDSLSDSDDSDEDYLSDNNDSNGDNDSDKGVREPPKQERTRLRIRGMARISDQRHTCFYTRCLVQNEEGLLTIDGGTQNNCVSASFVDRLGLSTTPVDCRKIGQIVPHYKGEEIRVDRQVKLKFSIGDYADEVVCDVLPKLKAADIVLGRAWQFDRRVIHDGFTNKYQFALNQVPFTLVPLSYDQMKQQMFAMQRRRGDKVVYSRLVSGWKSRVHGRQRSGTEELQMKERNDNQMGNLKSS